jgi:PKD repeat protein
MKFAQISLFLVAALMFAIEALASPRHVTAVWEYPAIENIAGFRLYRENNLVCSTSDSGATSMNCTIDAVDGESLFTMTAFFSDGTESAHSEPLVFIFASGLKAQFTSSPTGGESPLPVTFDGTSSAGDIITYDWMFGDGDFAAGAVVNHIFSTAGSYTVKLKVTDDAGAFDQKSLVLVVTDPTVANTPPVAVLSSSAATGRAPLPVEFNGGGSSDADGTILSYAWDLGDGGKASGAQVEYTYVNAGTFYPSLMVTDDGGLTDTVSTPVIVQPPLGTNIPPTAAISATAITRKLPLTVRFDGGRSTDADGNISKYAWNFGDGNTASGKTVRHKFTEAAEYKVSLIVTDNMGAVSQPAYFTMRVTKDGLMDTDGNRATRIIINFLLLESPTPKQPEKQQQQQ